MSYTDDDDEWSEPDEDGPDTIECPYCHEDIYEGSERCARCGTYISEEDPPSRAHPWWIALGALAVLGIVAMWVLRGW
jgi:hypothetical protein